LIFSTHQTSLYYTINNLVVDLVQAKTERQPEIVTQLEIECAKSMVFTSDRLGRAEKYIKILSDYQANEQAERLTRMKERVWSDEKSFLGRELELYLR